MKVKFPAHGRSTCPVGEGNGNIVGQVLRPNKTTLTTTPMPSELPIGKDNVVITFSADLLRYDAVGVITFTEETKQIP